MGKGLLLIQEFKRKNFCPGGVLYFFDKNSVLVYMDLPSRSLEKIEINPKKHFC